MPLKTSGCDSVVHGQYPPGFAFTYLPEQPPDRPIKPGEFPANQPPCVTEYRQLTPLLSTGRHGPPKWPDSCRFLAEAGEKRADARLPNQCAVFSPLALWRSPCSELLFSYHS